MKKYVKPELFFESYELSQNIAVCGWDMQSGDPNSCQAQGDPSWNVPEVLVFTVQNDACATPWEGYCYENSADDITIKIFQS